MLYVFIAWLGIVKVKAETHKQSVPILQQQKNTNEIRLDWNGNYSEIDTEIDNVAYNELDQSDNTIEIQNQNQL